MAAEGLSKEPIELGHIPTGVIQGASQVLRLSRGRLKGSTACAALQETGILVERSLAICATANLSIADLGIASGWKLDKAPASSQMGGTSENMKTFTRPKLLKSGSVAPARRQNLVALRAASQTASAFDEHQVSADDVRRPYDGRRCPSLATDPTG